MVYVYTMSTKEPYWTVNTIVPEQAGDTGWIQGGGYFTISILLCR